MDLSKLSVLELRKLDGNINDQMKKRQQQEVVIARNEIFAIARSVGIPVKELLNTGHRAKGSTASVQFRHPDDSSQQWSGRGRQPHWVRDWLGSGKSLDQLRIRS